MYRSCLDMGSSRQLCVPYHRNIFDMYGILPLLLLITIHGAQGSNKCPNASNIFGLPTVLGQNVEIYPIKSGYNLTLFDVNCEGSDATFWATSLDQNFNEHQGIKTKCSVEKRNLTLTVDRLDSENEYNFTVHAANKTVTEASIIRGSIPTPIRIPSIKAQLTEVSDLSATLSWSIDLDDCFVSKSINFTFSAIDSKFIKPESKILNKEECMKNRKVTLKVPLKPYREFNLTAMTCNGKNECGGNISLWGRTKAAVAGKLDDDKVQLQFDQTDSEKVITAVVNFTKDDCFGPTKFDFKLELLGGSSDLEVEKNITEMTDVKSPSYPNCPHNTEVIRIKMGNWHSYRFYRLTVRPSTDVGPAVSTKNYFNTSSAPAQDINPLLKVENIGTNEIQISWQFSGDECYGPTRFNVSYMSSAGDVKSTLHSSAAFPNCPMESVASHESIIIKELSADTQYVFYLTPFTDKGTHAYPASAPGRTQKKAAVSWYVVTVPIAIGAIIIVIGITITIRLRKKSYKSLIATEVYST